MALRWDSQCSIMLGNNMMDISMLDTQGVDRFKLEHTRVIMIGMKAHFVSVEKVPSINYTKYLAIDMQGLEVNFALNKLELLVGLDEVDTRLIATKVLGLGAVTEHFQLLTD